MCRTRSLRMTAFVRERALLPAARSLSRLAKSAALKAEWEERQWSLRRIRIARFEEQRRRTEKDQRVFLRAPFARQKARSVPIRCSCSRVVRVALAIAGSSRRRCKSLRFRILARRKRNSAGRRVRVSAVADLERPILVFHIGTFRFRFGRTGDWLRRAGASPTLRLRSRRRP